MSCPRQHGIFCRHPAGAFAAQKWWHRLLDRCGTDHPRITEFDQHRTFSMFCKVSGDTHLAQCVVFPTVISHHKPHELNCCSASNSAETDKFNSPSGRFLSNKKGNPLEDSPFKPCIQV